jgi:hypothetical protein
MGPPFQDFMVMMIILVVGAVGSVGNAKRCPRPVVNLQGCPQGRHCPSASFTGLHFNSRG